MSNIKEIAISNRPREKMIREGIECLTNEELLAIIIGSGGKNNSVLDISRALLDEYKSLSNLLNCDIYSLMKIKGIKKARAIAIMAIIEIVKRANKEERDFNKPISRAEDVYDLFKEELENEKQEKFLVLYLNIKLQIIKKETLFVGGSSSSLIDINFLFKSAISVGAKSIICIHNHPSGDPNPSKEDMLLTSTIKDLSKITKINLLDHIIIGKNGFFSFRKSNLDIGVNLL